jgi:hypothetical protein
MYFKPRSKEIKLVRKGINTISFINKIVIDVCSARRKQCEIARSVFSINTTHSLLGGVVVIVLATEPKGCGFKTSRGDGFLRAIKIRIASFFSEGK